MAHPRRFWLLSSAFVVVAAATLVLASWTSPWGTVHENDSTCNTEICERACRHCCLHFNPDNTSSGYLRCIAGCVGLGQNCGEPGGPGGPL